MNRFIFSVLMVVCFQCLYSQDKIELSGDAEVSSYIFENQLPFWLHANSGTFISSETNLAARFNIFLDYQLSLNQSFQLGAGLFYRDGVSEEFQRNNLYLKYRNKFIEATLGSKEVLDRFQGLGVVGDNFLLSGNARALPGFKIKLSNPLRVFNTIYLDAAIGHYSLNDERIVKNARVHNKSLDVIWKIRPNRTLSMGIEHFAQWGGESSLSGKQPASISDFIDIFFASNGAEESSTNDQLNALGNSLGYYKLQYDIHTTSAIYSFYHYHPFEDGSGTRLKNFPDGIWGFYYNLNETKYTSILKGFLLEYVSTVSQSGRFGRSGRDNYFNNRIYRNGWTYENNVIGLPFISVPDNSRIEAFNLGISLKLQKFHSSFKGSYVKSLGTYFNEFDPTRKQLYLLSENTYDINFFSSLRLSVGYDLNTNSNDNFGGGISYLVKL